jgi:GDP-L-fucose synthase
MLKKKLWVAGHNGMVGSAIARNLSDNSTFDIIKVDRKDLDLRNQREVTDWINTNKPEIIIFAAAKVGGIIANSTYPAEFIYDNLVIETNIIHGAHLANVNKLIFLGSSCIYPKYAKQPIAERELLSGYLEPTNEWYAIAKIAGIKLCQAYRKQYLRDYASIMPCNLYGPKDNYSSETSHVIPALIRKFHEAKLAKHDTVVLWGTGNPLREFLYVDDLADAITLYLSTACQDDLLNCGSGHEISIYNLACLIKDIVGFNGKIHFDATKPDGTPRKLMDSSKIRSLGWSPKIDIRTGLIQAYEHFLKDFVIER